MKQKFREVKLSKKNKERLDLINSIIEEYLDDGYTLTLRQLYYQLVSRDVIPNEQKEYAKLSRLLKEGRLGGVVDWEAIEDRLRKVRTVSTWDSPEEILKAAANQYKTDCLRDESHYLEVWVEKDALSQVVERAAKKYQVPVLVNRGYGSISAIYDTYERISDNLLGGKDLATILYLGDHDPSGLDMVRDINDRVGMMLYDDGLEDQFEVKHIALTMEQIEFYNPPPNPAKMSDSRAADYVREHGYTSWEVDALPPNVLDELITTEIESLIDVDAYNLNKQRQEEERKKAKEMIKKLYS